MLQTRREVLRDLTAALAGAALATAKPFTTPRADAAPDAPVAGWPQFNQPELGVALQYPPGWTVRILENGVAGATEGADGLTGARAYGQMFLLTPGANSRILARLFAQVIGQTFDGFRGAQSVQLTTVPDVSAVQYTVPFLDGPRKGMMMIGAAAGIGVLLGLDAPQPAFDSRVETLTRILTTFRWFASTLNLRQAIEPREAAFAVLVPGGWQATLGVIRPQIDAGFVARAVDPTGLLSAEVHRPQTPGFITPSPLLREGTWYDLGNKWGMQPLLVSRYMPGKEYLRSFLLPFLQRTRPGAQIAGWRDRPDLTLTSEMAISKRFGGAPAGGEAEYAWTDAGGRRRRGRAVVLTAKIPLATGGALWGAPFMVLAEAPESQLPTAVAAMIVASSSLHINVTWYATEIKAAAQRWRIIMDTERYISTEYQDAILRRSTVVLAGMIFWDDYIRYGKYAQPPVWVPFGLEGPALQKYIKEHAHP